MPSKSADQTGRQKTAKQLAAEAKAAAETAERRRERTIRIVGSLAVLLVVGGLITVGIMAGRDKDAGTPNTTAPTADPNAALPTGVVNDTYGVKYGTGWTAANEANLPTLELWQDFQCPGCKLLEDKNGENIQKMAEDGKMKLLYRPATFLDNSLADKNAANGNPNSSARATSAWGCSVDQGVTGPYLRAVYAIQPEDEGVGYSDQQLIDLGTTVGLTGDKQATFATCVQNGTYMGWAANSQEQFLSNGITGTPTGVLNGVKLSSTQLSDKETLEGLVADATAK